MKKKNTKHEIYGLIRRNTTENKLKHSIALKRKEGITNMGYEICGFIEQKNGVDWEPAIILTHMDGDFSPQNLDVSYIWSCGRTAFNEELVRYSTPVNKTHIKEIGKKLKPVDSDWGGEDSQPDEMLSISYGSLCYIASKSETPELAEYFVEQVERNLEILGLDEMPPDLIRFIFVESY